MQIRISPTDGVPIYQQIVNQIKYLAASGRLEPGEQLPSVRVLAEQLVINPNTVARAYRELETAGVLGTRRGAGVYLTEDRTSPLARRERLRILGERADQILAEADHMGIGVEEVHNLLDERHRRILSGKGKVSNE